MSYDRQCSSCGGFCGRGGCKRENVKPEQEPVYQISLTNGSAKAAWIHVDEATYYIAPGVVYHTQCYVKVIKRAHGIGDD